MYRNHDIINEIQEKINCINIGENLETSYTYEINGRNFRKNIHLRTDIFSTKS